MGKKLDSMYALHQRDGMGEEETHSKERLPWGSFYVQVTNCQKLLTRCGDWSQGSGCGDWSLCGGGQDWCLSGSGWGLS